MPRLAAPLVLALATLLGSSCASPPGPYDNHWTLGGLGPRLSYNLLSYRPDLDGSYRDHQWRQKKDINLTLRRHFLNSNPENPFQPASSGYGAPRPAHSILPDPVAYFHAESLFWGGAILAATGSFIPIPLASILGTITPGGPSEFAEGIGNTVTGSFHGTIGEPPSVAEFRVRNTSLLR